METKLKNTVIFTLKTLALLFLLTAKASAQFDTDTPTVTPTPKFNTLGTPIISTVWMEIDDGSANAKPTPTPPPNISDSIKVKEIPSDDSSGDLGLYPTSTPRAHSYVPVKTAASLTGMNKTSSTSKGSGSSSGYGKKAQTAASGGTQGGDTSEGSASGSGNGGSGGSGASNGMANGDGSSHGPLRMLDLYQTGIQDYKNKNFDDAVDHLKKALTIQDPTVPFYYYAEANAMLGIIYKFYRPDEALSREYCEKALKIDPTTKTAKKLIHEIGSTGTEAEQMYRQGIKSYESGQFREAATLLKEMVGQKDPATPSFYYAEADRTLGIIYHYYLKDKAKALKYYQAGLKIEPADQLAKRNMAKLLKN